MNKRLSVYGIVEFRFYYCQEEAQYDLTHQECFKCEESRKMTHSHYHASPFTNDLKSDVHRRHGRNHQYR